MKLFANKTISLPKMGASLGRQVEDQTQLVRKSFVQISVHPLVLRAAGYFRRNVKDKSGRLIRLWTRQCEFIAAQRLRQGQQLLQLYARLWEEHKLRELLAGFRRQMQRHGRGCALSAALVACFDWDKERIELESVKDQLEEFDLVERLKLRTIYCPKCGKRRMFHSKVAGVEYCVCRRNENVQKVLEAEASEEDRELLKWEPYIERKDMITWRHEDRPGLFSYKVYVEYPDVTAEDFLHVQTDVEYRKKWDNTAVRLEVIDCDAKKGSNSAIIYWEMLWPKLFDNRDYVYNRRCFVDRKRKLIVIASRSTQHPKCPPRPDNHRVTEYWSYMVIKPKTSFSKPGLEFVLTYFDNPGLSIPKSITTWVAQRQMPDFLDKLHKATLDYARMKRDNEERKTYYWEKDPGYEYPNLDVDIKDEEEEEDDIDNDLEFRMAKCKNVELPQLDDDDADELGGEEQQKKSSWWSYLLFYNYFF